jgi:hypothetical protein
MRRNTHLAAFTVDVHHYLRLRHEWVAPERPQLHEPGRRNCRWLLAHSLFRVPRGHSPLEPASIKS